jgi:PAS domain S-box-containing protein
MLSRSFTYLQLRNKLTARPCIVSRRFMPKAKSQRGEPLLQAKVKAKAKALLASNFLESIPDAIVAVAQDGLILQVNSKTEEMFGFRRGQLVGQPIEMLVPERYRDLHYQHRQNFAKAPKTRRMGAGLDLYGRRQDGSEFPVEISLSPITLENGTLVVLSAIRDISDRKRIEAELRRANQELKRRTAEELGEYRSRLASIVDSSEDAIIGKDLDGTIISWNKSAERIYGYRSEEAIGKPIAILAPKDRLEEIPRILERIRHGERFEHYETVRVTKDGRHLDVSISISPLHNAAGEIVGASAIARDVTAQKRTEHQLRQAQKIEAIGRLAGGVAHDFNNILGIITACTEFLHDRIAPGTGPRQYVDNIGEAAERGASLTRQLLAFSRRQAIEPQILDLNERLKVISKLLRPLMGDDVEVVLQTKSPLVLVEADPNQLDQVVLNLAVNARDAMPQGGKFVLTTETVELNQVLAQQHQPMTAGKYVMLAVSDNGSGMDDATSSRIFEPFFTTKETGKGTGLGLATVYGIIKQSGGHIWVDSEPGRGTTFRIYLPSADHKLGTEPKADTDAVIPKGRQAAILLVEDDEIMRGLTRQLLEEQGYTVLEAKDGKTALQCASSRLGEIKVLLTDMVMHGMNGLELAARLTESNPALKVVFMSGYGSELIRERGVREQDIVLLEKPFTRTALLNAIHAALP